MNLDPWNSEEFLKDFKAMKTIYDFKNVFFLTSQDSYDNITEINDSVKKILKIFKEGNIKP